jgi:adenosylcobinamide-GDP ribazoletransferase
MDRDDPLRGLAALMGIFTVIPSRGSPEEAARWFYAVPVIGFVRGLITSISLLALGHFPPYVVAGLAVALHYVGQGFMHADGFADFSEALAASRFGADPRAVLKDTHRGSFAVASFAVLVTLLFSASLYAASSGYLLAFVVAEVGHVMGMAAAIRAGREEPYEGMARTFKEHMSNGMLAEIYLLSAIIVFLLGGGGLVVGVPIAAAIAGWASAAAANRIVGFTNGDAIGFAGEVAYLASLLMIAHA